MTGYKTRTIVGTNDGYEYGKTALHARGKKALACAYSRARQIFDQSKFRPEVGHELCIQTWPALDSSDNAETWIVRVVKSDAETGKYRLSAMKAVTPKIRDLARRLLDLLEEVEDLPAATALRFARLLESIELDTCCLDDPHPVSAQFIASLNQAEVLSGVRLMLHCNHSIAHLSHGAELEQYGGFTPPRQRPEK